MLMMLEARFRNIAYVVLAVRSRDVDACRLQTLKATRVERAEAAERRVRFQRGHTVHYYSSFPVLSGVCPEDKDRMG